MKYGIKMAWKDQQVDLAATLFEWYSSKKKRDQRFDCLKTVEQVNEETPLEKDSTAICLVDRMLTITYKKIDRKM